MIVVTLIGLEIYLHQLHMVAIKEYKIAMCVEKAGLDFKLENNI